MKPQKTNDETRMLISIKAQGVGKPSLEEFETLCNTDASQLLPNGEWEALFFQFFDIPGQLKRLVLPGTAVIGARILGPVDDDVWARLDEEAGQVHQAFMDNVLAPWLSFWADQVGKLGIEAGQEEWERVQKYTRGLCNYFANWLPAMASTDAGRTQLEKESGFRSIKDWYITLIAGYMLFDVRVTLGNADLTRVMAAKFAELVKEHFSVPLPCLMQ